MMPILIPLLVTAAMAAADPASAVVHLSKDEVAARAAAQGFMVVKSDRYKVMLAERDKRGEAEVHATDTDVLHILSLSGTVEFVTGGTVVDPKTTAPGETRGPSIEGGALRPLAQGDVLVIPAGVPHWFKTVDGKVQYFVVKVAQ